MYQSKQLMNRFLLRNDGGVFKGMKKMFVLPFRVNSFLVDLKQHKAYNLGGTTRLMLVGFRKSWGLSWVLYDSYVNDILMIQLWNPWEYLFSCKKFLLSLQKHHQNLAWWLSETLSFNAKILNLVIIKQQCTKYLVFYWF